MPDHAVLARDEIDNVGFARESQLAQENLP